MHHARIPGAQAELPAAGSESLTIDRINAYFIEAEFKTNEAATGQDAPELFYFEVYWD